MAGHFSGSSNRRMNDSDNENEDSDFSLLTRIPHGIKQKRSNRRKSATLSTNTKGKLSSDIINPITLTVPRGNSSKTISRKNLIKAKANLDAKFKNITERRDEKRQPAVYEAADSSVESQLLSYVDYNDLQESQDETNEESYRGRIYVEKNTNYSDYETGGDSTAQAEDNTVRDEKTQFVSFNSSKHTNSDDSYPHTPVENEIQTPLVSPEFSFKRRLLVGEVSGRKVHKRNPVEERSIDAVIRENGSKKENILNVSDDDNDNYENSRFNGYRDTHGSSDDSIMLENETTGQIKYHDETSEHLNTNGHLDTTNGTFVRYEDATETSRIEQKNKHDETTDREEFYSVIDGGNEGPSTPSRMTESIAVSPRTEQESRIIDQPETSLDTSRPANVEAPESPLTKHKSPRRKESPIKNGKAKKARRQSILGFLDKDGDELLSELTKLINETLEDKIKSSGEEDASFTNPSDKPTFTIKQFAKIQNQYDDDLSVLKKELNMKNKEILKLSESLSSTNLKVQNLQNELESMRLLEKQLQEKNKLLTKEFELYERNVSQLQGDVASKDEKLASYIKLSNRFKELYKDKQTEITSLKNETSRQKSNLEILQEEKTNLTDKIQYLEDKVSKLNTELSMTSTKYDELNNEIKSLKEKNEAIDEENYGLRHQLEDYIKEKEELEQDIEHYNHELDSERENRKKLQRENLELQNAIDESKEESKELQQKLESYKDDLVVIDLENQQLQKETNELSSLIKAKNTKIEEYEEHFETLNDKYLSSLSENKEKLNELNKTNTKISSLSSTIKQLREENESLKAQADTLQEELEGTKGSLETDKGEFEELQHKYHSLLQEANSKDSQISEYQEKLTKMEETHIEELEKIQHEITSLKNSVNAKNTELYHLQDNSDTLTEENQRLSDKVSSMTEELNAAKKQIEALKSQQFESEKRTEERLTKLSEDLYVQYSKKHEQKIAILKKGYETKWQSKLNHATAAADSLKREVDGLKDRLANERKEKAELVKLWDRLVKMEDAGNKIQKA